MRSTKAHLPFRASIASLALALLASVHSIGLAKAAGTASDHPLAARELEAATTRPTKLGLAGPFFALYPPESCAQTELDNAVFLYVCHVGGRPQEFHLDLAIPGLIVLTGVSLNGETPNLGPSLAELARELGIRVSPESVTGANGTGTAANGAATSATRRPPYVGAWAETAKACTFTRDFYRNTVISRLRIEVGGRACAIAAATPIASTYVLALNCDALDDEAPPTPTLARLTMETRDRITFEREDGTKATLQRCQGTIPDEYRQIVEE